MSLAQPIRKAQRLELAKASRFLAGRAWAIAAADSTTIRLGARDVGGGDDHQPAWRGRGAEQIAALIAASASSAAPSAQAGQARARVIVQSWPMAGTSTPRRSSRPARGNLGRAGNPRPAGVKASSGAAVDRHAAVPGPLGEIAVAPNVEALEIGGAVPLAVEVVPSRPTPTRKGEYEPGSPAAERASVPRRPGVHRHAEPRPLNLAARHAGWSIRRGKAERYRCHEIEAGSVVAIAS